jgi:hypothetical protein
MTPRVNTSDPATVEGRLRKAHQFMEAAETINELADDEQDVADAYVTLCVHAGIAASDAICGAALGQHVHGDDHNAAIAQLSKVRPNGRNLAESLRALLSMKTRAGYSHERVGANDRKRATRAAQKLLSAARDKRIGS